MQQKVCLFCEFIKRGKRSHHNRLPFSILHQTKNTISFLSIDFPEPKHEHVLVIPKKHYVNLEECPPKVLHELIEHVALISKALRIENDGCNILLNDGRSAEQSVLHTHFHVVPRNKRDKIEIELWKRAQVRKEEFVALNKKVADLIKQVRITQ